MERLGQHLGLGRFAAGLEGLIPSDSYLHTLERFRRQLLNAREWRDVLNNYFRRFSGAADEKGRTFY